MRIVNSLFSLLSQFAPVLITLALAAGSYWAALKADLSLYNLSGKKNLEQPDYFLKDLKVQSLDVELGRATMLNGVEAEHIPKSNLWNITQPSLKVVSKDGRTLEGKAEKGIYDPVLDQIQLKNDVSIDATSAGEKTRINSATLNINNKTSILSTKDRITVVRANQQFEAAGVEWRQQEGQLKTYGAVKFLIEGKR